MSASSVVNALIGAVRSWTIQLPQLTVRRCFCLMCQQVRAVLDQVVGAAGESIGHDVGLALDVLDVEVEVGDDVLPARLAAGQHRLRLEELQRLVVRQHGELARRAGSAATASAHG